MALSSFSTHDLIPKMYMDLEQVSIGIFFYTHDCSKGPIHQGIICVEIVTQDDFGVHFEV